MSSQRRDISRDRQSAIIYQTYRRTTKSKGGHLPIPTPWSMCRSSLLAAVASRCCTLQPTGVAFTPTCTANRVAVAAPALAHVVYVDMLISTVEHQKHAQSSLVWLGEGCH